MAAEEPSFKWNEQFLIARNISSAQPVIVEDVTCGAREPVIIYIFYCPTEE